MTKFWTDEVYNDLCKLCPLLTSKEVELVINEPSKVPILNSLIGLALEVREYRKRYGRLSGINGEFKWLSKD